jgi:ribonuclease VapC
MVIDSSAVLAILQNEPERRAFNEAIAAAETRLLSAASLVELSIVLEARFGPEGQGDLDLFLSTAQIEIVALDRDQAELARGAFSRYGKGRHRAGLNFGDCFAYALAQWAGDPLLFKGDDFSHTDLQSAWPPVGFSVQE